MDIATIGAGITSLVGTFGSTAGPILLTVAGLGMGYYFLGFTQREVKIRVRNSGKTAAA